MMSFRIGNRESGIEEKIRPFSLKKSVFIVLPRIRPLEKGHSVIYHAPNPKVCPLFVPEDYQK